MALSFNRRFQIALAFDRIQFESYDREKLYQVEQLQAMRWVHRAWYSEVSQLSIANCFKATKILGNSSDLNINHCLNENAEEQTAIEKELRLNSALIYQALPDDVSVEIESQEERDQLRVYLTEEQIIDTINSEEVHSVDDEEDTAIRLPIPVKDKLAAANRFLEILADDESDVEEITRLVRQRREKYKENQCLTQSRIVDHFGRQ